jgi:hypothetical protein
MFRRTLLNLWWLPILLLTVGVGLLVAFTDNPAASFISYLLMVAGTFSLLLWSSAVDGRVRHVPLPVVKSGDKPTCEVEHSDVLAELGARIREAAEFKAELEAKRAEIAALKSGLNRTDSAELNEAIAQLYIDLEFERGRAEGDFAQILAGLLESVDGLFTAAALVKGAPTIGERFVDQPAGSCKVFKTELTSDVALKGTIKAVRSPWVGFMANGKLKIITASNISVYA